MRCKACPLSLTCLSGRLHDAFMLVALCPLCGKLYLIRHPKEENQRTRHEAERQEEAAKHGIDLAYELTAPPHRFEQELMGTWVPVPRTTMLRLKCEKHRATLADKRRWNRNKPEAARYRYSQGWVGVDGMNFRPCPECVRWPEPHVVEDLDEQAIYEAEKAGAQPAFRLKNRR